jgi:pyruvate formate lyase activating enzyme
MIIGGMMVSSVEFPDNIALVIFTRGCILRCPYCHNPELIEGGKSLELTEITKKIEDSIEFIDGVVITGGEPLIQYKAVGKILSFSKKRGLKTKIDTNGYFPERLGRIIELVDYVALDVKAPFDKYKEIIGSDIGTNVKKSMEICLNHPNTYLECRTTYVPSLMKPSDIVDIASQIKCDRYTIQQFRNRVVLDERFHEIPNPSRDELKEIADTVKPFIKNLRIKTAEFGDELVESS